MFISMPEYIQAVCDERERETQQLILQAWAAETLLQDDRPRAAARPWTHFVTVRMPRSFHMWSGGRA
jgi:hypothetical protein